MNSLNLISAKVGIGTKTKQRSRSVGDVIRHSSERPAPPKRSASQHVKASVEVEEEEREKADTVIKNEVDVDRVPEAGIIDDEKQPLLADGATKELLGLEVTKDESKSLLRRIFAALRESLRWALSKLLTPGVYLLACFRGEDGQFSALTPMRRQSHSKVPKSGRNSTAHAIGLSGSLGKPEHPQSAGRSRIGRHHDSDGMGPSHQRPHSPRMKLNEESRTQSSSDDTAPARRSIRIRVNNDEAARRRKQRRSQRTASDVAKLGSATQEELAAAELKSPTSPASSLGLTKYPHAPKPPRPLIPRRQPSYTKSVPSQSSSLSQKTLVLDLDETLIHSLAKGGRMSSGHMVEVRLAHTLTQNGVAIGPQHPILYYVHKRPHCDDFLRKISKWYNLVVFTASVQEYADPVIDWLEQERKYFSARYYRQHCTFRNGAYIKDLSSIEPDLSKVMILDNSPLSYIFHEGKTGPDERGHPRLTWRQRTQFP